MIKVRFSNGVFEPLEPIEFPEGNVFTITTLDAPSTPESDAFKRSAGG